MRVPSADVYLYLIDHAWEIALMLCIFAVGVWWIWSRLGR